LCLSSRLKFKDNIYWYFLSLKFIVVVKWYVLVLTCSFNFGIKGNIKVNRYVANLMLKFMFEGCLCITFKFYD
jgi:hypothetical protein